MNCEQNVLILRINKRCVEACLAQTPLYFVEQFVFICSAIKHRNTGKEKLFTHTKRYRARNYAAELRFNNKMYGIKRK